LLVPRWKVPFKILKLLINSKQIEIIKVPALIKVGEDDVLTPLNDSEMLDKSIPNSILIKVPSAGHYVVNEQCDVFQNHKQEFIEELDNK
jgi:pimeloyl-ACP methyl ester carboxylesterase